MTEVRVCRVCGHTSDHGVSGDRRLKSTMADGVTPRNICQVPIYTPLPDGLSKIGTPCGCDGTGEPMVPIPPTVLAPPPKCFRPGCPEFAVGQSSFCSERCKDEMAAAIAKFGGDYGNTERSSGPSVQDPRQRDQGAGHRDEGRPDEGGEVLGQAAGWLDDGDAVDDRRGSSDLEDEPPRAALGAEGDALRGPAGDASTTEVEVDWLDA